MVPEKIQPFVEVSCQKNKGGNEIVEGALTCCASHDFEVFAEGELKRGIFSKLYLLPENDRLALKARCKKCGRDIPLISRMSIRRISKSSRSMERRRAATHLRGYGQRSNAAAAALCIRTS